MSPKGAHAPTTDSAQAPSVDSPPFPAERTPASLQSGWNHALEELLTDRTGFLDGVDSLLGGLSERVGATPVGNRVLDALSGRFMGHALHPALSDLPIGFWAASSLCALGAVDGPAEALTAAGVAASLVTAASGTADWRWLSGRQRRLGLIHGAANTAGLLFQLGALLAWRTGRVQVARTLSVSGTAVAGAAAYLGGELVLGQGIGVDHTAFIEGPSDWTPLLRLEDIEDGGVRGVDLAGRRLLVHRRGSEVSVIENACSHLGGPLDEGEVADGSVTCPWHGSVFRLSDGCALHGPASVSQPRLQARIVAGRVEVRGRE